ncbi:hypothetical protein HZB74_03185 [Candidatus Saccharibacteria bacterium]|nr:hypothetical protein [Candidatus Saccharibacteria bacterium]
MLKTPEMRSLVACGLILATPFGAGCGASELDKAKKIEVNTQKNVKELEKTFSPAMASIGRRAVKFIEANPDDGFIYKMGKSKNLSISKANGYEVNISLISGASTRKIENGEVESIVIKKDNSDRRANEIRIEPAEDDSGVCARGGLIASSERFDTSDEENELTSFITANRCKGHMLNPNLDDPSQDLRPVGAAERVINDINLHFTQATRGQATG